MELTCAVQKYAWGKLGISSEVACLQSASNPAFKIEEFAPYAELWMGTHPNGPSVIASSGVSLDEYIKKTPTVLGERSRATFGDDLPFLFKVLSVNKALSIQAHPDKKHAEKLYKTRPEVYNDPNHKPEMAIALTPFEGLCGFRPLAEIQGFLRDVKELYNVVGDKAGEDLIAATESDYSSKLKEAFSALMRASKALLEENLQSLRKKIDEVEDKSFVQELFLRLLDQYPGDVGCFVIYFVNYLKLQPGEAMFLGPNLIHAYLSGDCIECMACSDNVVRAGLTPKMIDVDTLCSMLEYRCSGPQEMKFCPEMESEAICVYNPPVPDFSVARIVVKESLEIPARKSASILLVTKGAGFYGNGGDQKSIKRGMALFLTAGETLTAKKVGDEDIVIFQAYC